MLYPNRIKEYTTTIIVNIYLLKKTITLLEKLKFGSRTTFGCLLSDCKK